MSELPVERHPLKPFLPCNARVLLLGSFPPARKRWSMDFFYPNWINDMWRITGAIFFKDKEHFIAREADGVKAKRFDKERIERFCTEKGIALYDTAVAVRRLKDNASDKFLEVAEYTDIVAILKYIPDCQAIITTGQKATDIIVETFGCAEPGIGEKTGLQISDGRHLNFWRMPSSSRAYPLALEKKAAFYEKMYIHERMI